MAPSKIKKIPKIKITAKCQQHIQHLITHIVQLYDIILEYFSQIADDCRKYLYDLPYTWCGASVANLVSEARDKLKPPRHRRFERKIMNRLEIYWQKDVFFIPRNNYESHERKRLTCQHQKRLLMDHIFKLYNFILQNGIFLNDFEVSRIQLGRQARFEEYFKFFKKGVLTVDAIPDEDLRKRLIREYQQNSRDNISKILIDTKIIGDDYDRFLDISKKASGKLDELRFLIKEGFPPKHIKKILSKYSSTGPEDDFKLEMKYHKKMMPLTKAINSTAGTVQSKTDLVKYLIRDGAGDSLNVQDLQHQGDTPLILAGFKS